MGLVDKNWSAEDKQRIVDELHAAKIYPSRLIGMGSPAHVEAINANLLDLRNNVVMINNALHRLFTLVESRSMPAASVEKKPSDIVDDA